MVAAGVLRGGAMHTEREVLFWGQPIFSFISIPYSCHHTHSWLLTKNKSYSTFLPHLTWTWQRPVCSDENSLIWASQFFCLLYHTSIWHTLCFPEISSLNGMRGKACWGAKYLFQGAEVSSGVCWGAKCSRDQNVLRSTVFWGAKSI